MSAYLVGPSSDGATIAAHCAPSGEEAVKQASRAELLVVIVGTDESSTFHRVGSSIDMVRPNTNGRRTRERGGEDRTTYLLSRDIDQRRIQKIRNGGGGGGATGGGGLRQNRVLEVCTERSTGKSPRERPPPHKSAPVDIQNPFWGCRA